MTTPDTRVFPTINADHQNMNVRAKNMTQALRLLVMLTLIPVLLLPACAKKERVQSEQEMYDSAYKALSRARYEVAVERYDALRAAYPYGKYATQGDLEICYAYYKTRQFEVTVPCVDRFLANHPTHSQIDYAYYLKGLALLPVRPPKFGERFFRSKADLTDHDAESGRAAYAAFNEVIERFPLSEYADSSREKLVQLINIFARHDLQIALFYLKRQAYVAAINRASRVLQRFESSPFTEQALAILVYSYSRLNLQELADDNREVLQFNYPASIYLTDAGAIFDESALDLGE